MYKDILLPERREDITLGQCQRYIELIKREDLDELSRNKRFIEIFTSLKFREVEQIKYSDYEDIVLQIHKALTTETKFKNRFKINDVEFGFIPNFDDCLTKEYIDMGLYDILKDVDVEKLKGEKLTWLDVNMDDCHKLMAVLFRPIKNTDFFGNYLIEEYQGTKQHADVMKYMPMSIVDGAIVFFCNLSRELKNHILKYTEVVQERVQKLQDTLKNGDGTQR